MCLFPITVVSAADQAVRSAPVRIGWYEDAYNITDEHGERRGYGYEFQQAVAGYTSWNYDYVRADSVFVKILQKNWLGVFLSLKNLSRGFAPTLRYPRIFF